MFFANHFKNIGIFDLNYRPFFLVISHFDTFCGEMVFGNVLLLALTTDSFKKKSISYISRQLDYSVTNHRPYFAKMPFS